MKKTVWITVLDHDEEKARELYQSMSTYGLDAQGHFWTDDLEKMTWAGAREDLMRKETALWLIAGTAKSFESESVRYGLSMLAVSVHAMRGHGFPILIAPRDGEINVESLPTPLKSAEVLPASGSSIGPKIVAKANMPIKKVHAEYRMDVYALPGAGQWFEVGPDAGHSWKGVMFGVLDGEISAHGVGAKGQIPEKCVLEYQQQGLKLQMGEKEYVAWAVQNEISENDSYYIGVKGSPSSTG